MNRPYENTPQKPVEFFVGTEVENTPMHGRTTLFVVGSPTTNNIIDKLKLLKLTSMTYDDGKRALTYHNKIEHIYLGANKSFNAEFDISLVHSLLESGYYVTLDYPYEYHGLVVHKLGDIYSNSNFIPMISVEIPNINRCNYNTTIKLDDIGFNTSNPGVWCHSLRDLQSKDSFTPWRLYKGDTAL